MRIESNRLLLLPRPTIGDCNGSGRQLWVRELVLVLVVDAVGMERRDVLDSSVARSRQSLRQTGCALLLPRHQGCWGHMDCRSRMRIHACCLPRDVKCKMLKAFFHVLR